MPSRREQKEAARQARIAAERDAQEQNPLASTDYIDRLTSLISDLQDETATSRLPLEIRRVINHVIVNLDNAMMMLPQFDGVHEPPVDAHDLSNRIAEVGQHLAERGDLPGFEQFIAEVEMFQITLTYGGDHIGSLVLDKDALSVVDPRDLAILPALSHREVKSEGGWTDWRIDEWALVRRTMVNTAPDPERFIHSEGGVDQLAAEIIERSADTNPAGAHHSAVRALADKGVELAKLIVGEA